MHSPSTTADRVIAQSNSDLALRVRRALLAAAGVLVIAVFMVVLRSDLFRSLFGLHTFARQILGVWLGLWALAAVTWLSCVLMRAKGYRAGWGLVGVTGVGALLPVLLPQKSADVLEQRREARWFGWQHFLSIFLVFVCVVAAFWNSIKLNPSGFDGWTLDNLYIIKYDPRHRATSWHDGPGAMEPGVKQIFLQDYWWPKGISGLFRPITTLTYWLNYTVFGNGTDTTYYHLVNFFLHWANASLVYVLACRLMGRWTLALCAAAIFAVHPITVESVTNIIGRADLFAALAVLLGLLAWIRAASSAGLRRIGWYLGVMLITAFGVFAKESSLAIGLAVVAYDLVYRWSLDDFRSLRDVRRPAVAYTVAFVILLGVPLISGAIFARDEWFMFADPSIAGALKLDPVTVGARYARAGVAAAGGIFIYLFTRRSTISVRRIAVILAMLAAVISSLHVQWFGLVVTFTIGLFELAHPVLAPLHLAASSAWRSFCSRYVIGYYLLLPPVIAMAFVRHWVFRNSTPPETPFLDNPLRGGPFDPLPFWQTRATAVKVMGKLAYLLFWPLHLSSDYSYDQIPLFTWNLLAWENLKTLIAFAFVIGCFAAAIYYYRRDRALSFYILFFFAAILPTSNLIQLIGSIMAERFMYLPLIGFCSAIVIAAAKLLSAATRRLHPPAIRRIALAGVPAIVVALLAARTYVRNYDWFSDVTLWRSAQKVSPRSFRCYQSLAFALFEQHQQRNIDEMIAVAEAALPIVDKLPDEWNSSRLYLHLGMYYQIKGDMLAAAAGEGQTTPSEAGRPWYEKSAAALERASRIDRAFSVVNYRKQIARGDKPGEITDVGLTPIYAVLGSAYYKLGRYREAINAHRYQIHLDPAADPDPYFRIAQAYLQIGNADDAAASLVECLLADQKRADAWNLLAQIYNAAGSRMANSILVEDGVPRLNFSHPVVRDNVRDAHRDLIRILRRAKRTQHAEQMRKVAVENYGFPRSMFDPLFSEPLPKVTPQGLEYPAAGGSRGN